MSDVCIHLIHWVLGRGNEHEFPRAGITLMTLRAALCAVTFDLCSSSLTKNTTRRNTHACTHTDSCIYTYKHIHDIPCETARQKDLLQLFLWHFLKPVRIQTPNRLLFLVLSTGVLVLNWTLCCILCCHLHSASVPHECLAGRSIILSLT